ncbi:IS982 family transposase, partial [Thiotrichales bacterium HSG14]|nr:IS982 family transposase [Thiotrichales bacterium HSG14]
LTERFHIQKVRSRDLWHLTNRVTRKIMAHTIGVFLNRLLGRPSLQFESLVEA